MRGQLWAVTGVYVAGVIGAGFASGQELTVFFVNYGRAGIFGIIIAVLFLFVGTGLILQFAAKHKVSSYGQILATLDPNLSLVFDLLYALFIIIGISVMFAGIGAMGETFLASLLWRAGSAILVFIVLYRGVEGVLRMSSWLAPFLVVVFCVIAFRHLQSQEVLSLRAGNLRAIESGTLYACYNLGFSLAVLASIHHYLPTARKRWQLAMTGSLILGVCMTLLYFSLSTLTPQQLEHPFPLVHLLASWGYFASVLYKIMLWGAMYTTAVANCLALVSRITEFRGISWARATLGVVLLGIMLSYFGFSNLIRIAYPILGLAGLWIMAHLLREYMV